MKLSGGGTIEWPKVTSRGIGVQGVTPGKILKFETIWCNLVQFGKKFTFFQFSMFVNENIVIVLDSGISHSSLTYYFNYLVV